MSAPTRAPAAPGVTVEDLAGPDAAGVLARLRATGPVTWVPAVEAWLVTSHAVALTVMRDADTYTVDDPRFSTARVVGPSMLSLDGAAHQRHRTPFAAAFRPSRVEERFGAEVEQLAGDPIERVRPDGRADLRTALAGPLSVLVVADALGLRDVDVDTVLAWYTAIVGAVTTLSAGGEADAAPAVAALAGQVRSRQHEDSVLTAARERLSEAEIVANAAVMMFGGIETTEGMITNVLLHLLRHPVALAEVRHDPSLIGAAVEESLRLEPAAAVVDRYATHPAVLAGVDVPRGDLVRVSITAANRDPQVFAEPDRFAPGRPDVGAQLAFARGPHTCIAMDLARLETRVAVRAVLDSLPGLRPAGPAAAHGLIFRKPPSLPVAWDVDGQPASGSEGSPRR